MMMMMRNDNKRERLALYRANVVNAIVDDDADADNDDDDDDDDDEDQQ